MAELLKLTAGMPIEIRLRALIEYAQWGQEATQAGCCPWCAAEWWTGHDEDCDAAVLMGWRTTEAADDAAPPWCEGEG